MVMGDGLSHTGDRLFDCTRDTGAFDPGVISPTARPVTFMGVDAMVSGTGNPLIEIVASTAFGPPKSTWQ